ncbi:hypothetical protein ACC738_10525, partial [Rhizobium ruizarguesonis]
GKVHMAQFSMEIMRLTGSVLRGNQQKGSPVNEDKAVLGGYVFCPVNLVAQTVITLFSILALDNISAFFEEEVESKFKVRHRQSIAEIELFVAQQSNAVRMAFLNFHKN